MLRVYDDKLIIDRYLIDKISTYKISKELGLCNSTIRNRLKRLGIKLRDISSAQRLIPHIGLIARMGYEEWYRHAQSTIAREKRSISHTGEKFSEERKRHMREGIGHGDKNHRWLGNNAGYSSKHITINKYWPKTGVCQNCGKVGIPNGHNKIGTQWANVDHKYNRDDKSTWMEMCSSCNLLYDKGKITLRNQK